MKAPALTLFVATGIAFGGNWVAHAQVDLPATEPPPATDLPPPSSPAAETPAVVPEPTPGLDQMTAPLAPAPVDPLAAPAEPFPPPARPMETDVPPQTPPVWMSRVGSAMMVGGGYENFTYGNIRAMTGGGGSWDARLVGGTRQVIGLEAAYVGTAHSIQALGASSSSNLISNGGEAALRLNIPLARGTSLVEPFGFVGVGWQHYTVTNNSAATSDLSSSDDVLTVPYGGGLELAYRMVMLDARFTYRQTFRNDLLRAEGDKLNTWGVGGNVGLEF
jgi:hypothetical protein